MAELIEEAKNPQIGTSLAVFKPQRIIDFVWEESTREWNKQKLDVVYANQAQHSLFDVEETKRIFKVAKKLPYEFSYKFISEDGGKSSVSCPLKPSDSTPLKHSTMPP